MPVKKGHTNNPKGKPKGTKNKLKMSLRETIAAFLENNSEEVFNTWKMLDPKDKLKFWSDLLKYSIPQMSSVSGTVELKNQLENLPESEIDRIIEKITSK